VKFLACCVLPDKTLYGNCLYWLNILYWKFFHLSVEKQSLLWNFSLYWIYFFTIQDFWATLRLPWKTEFALKFLSVLSKLLQSGFLRNLRLPEKQSVLWIYCIEYIFFIIQVFWATCACPEKQSSPEIFHCIEHTFTFRSFAQFALALKNGVCREIFHGVEYIFFIIQDFWGTCACPENRVCPEIFQDRGQPPSPTPRLVRLCVVLSVSSIDLTSLSGSKKLYWKLMSE